MIRPSAVPREQDKNARVRELLAAAKPKRSKYRAVRTIIDGITFASNLEARVYSELIMRQRAGDISDLQLQPVFPLVVCGVKVATYVGDFQFYQRGGVDGWTLVVADAKGFKTPIYRLKRKLMKACHNIDILEL